MSLRNCISFFFLTLISVVASAQVNTNRMMQVGRNALYFEDYVLSIQYFNRVINVKPYLADPYYYRAVAKYYLDDLSGCEADCDVALGINPFLIDAYNLRGIAKLRRHRSAEASEDFSQGLKFEPENINLLMNKGVAQINTKDYDDAISSFDKLLSIDKKNVHAILYRGIAIVEKGDTAAAMGEFQRAAQINKYSADAYTYMGMIAFQTHDYKSALRYYDKLHELRPKDANVYVNRAITRYNLDDWKGASADLDEALRLDNKNIMAYQNRGILRSEAGDLNNAVADFSHVLRLDPSDDIALMNRALLYVQLGELTNAMRDLNIIIAKHPDFGPAYGQRAIVKRSLGDAKGAEVDYLTAMNFEQERIKQGLANAEAADSGKAPDSEKNKKKSRGKADKDMRKYNQLVVVADFGDNDNKLQQETKEKIRGRVQDSDIAVDVEPVFSLTFFAADTLLPNARYYKKSVQDYNALRLTPRQLVISNREYATDNVSVSIYEEIANLSRQIEQSPRDPNLYVCRATLYAAVMNYNSAIADYSAALLISPDNIDVQVNALFCRAATRYKMVETLRSMDSDPTFGSENSMLSGVRNDVTILDYDLIRQDLEKLIKLEPDNEFAYYNLALVCLARRQTNEAVDFLNKAIEFNPTFAEAFFNRGIVDLHIGNEKSGIADLSKAGELGLFKAYNVIKRQRGQQVDDEE